MNDMKVSLALVVLLLAIALPFGGSLSIVQGVEPTCVAAGRTDSDVLLCDDFEDGSFLQHWSIGSNSGTWPNSDFVMCGRGFGFHSRCAAWSNRLIFDTYWGFWGYDAWRRFLPHNEFYVRWYQYISDPYAWGTLEDKAVMLHDPVGSNDPTTITAYVATNRNQLPSVPNSGPGKPFVANYQDLDLPETEWQYTKINRFQNQDHDITLQPGRWYLFEWYLKMNTPGVSDGVTTLWIDDASRPISRQTLRLQYDDMRWLRSSDAGKQFGFLRLTVYDQRCDIHPQSCPPGGPAILNQSQRWDHIVVSRSPVGPIPPPPSCELAQAVPSLLWPPNHRMVPIAIARVTDPENEPLTITIVSVTQDEPVDEAGDDDMAPDAVVQGNAVLLRAERSGRGNGRSYEVHFVARAPRGSQCAGTVRVGVPHSMAPGLGIVHDGQIYDSTRR